MTTLSDRKRRSAVLHPRPRKSASRRTTAKASVHRTEKRTKAMIWIVASGRDATSAVMASPQDGSGGEYARASGRYTPRGSLRGDSQVGRRRRVTWETTACA